MKKLPRGTRKGARKWPASKLIPIVMDVASVSGTAKRYKDSWPVAVATLVSIYRDERAKVRAIDSFNLTASVASTQTGKKDEEDGE